MTPFFNTLTVFYEFSDFFHKEELKTLNLEIIEIIQDECVKTKYATKLMASTGLICSLTDAILFHLENEKLEKTQILERLQQLGIIDLMSHFLNHEYPKVCKTMSAKLYLFIDSSGNKFLSDQQVQDLTQYLSATEWLMIDITNLEALKNNFRNLIGLPNIPKSEQNLST